MKFKPIALVVIGLLLGSTVTQYFVTPSISTAEILACFSKTSGKTRLTTSGTCDSNTETETPVTDLWSLLPTTSAPTRITEAAQTKTYVVDGNGKNIGLLTDTEGREAYWVQTETGKWRLSLSDIDVSGILRPLNSMEGPVYIDARCTSPLFRPISTSRTQDERAVVEVIITKNGKKSTSKRGFRIDGELIALPKITYGFSYSSDNMLTCAVQDESVFTDDVPKKVYKSKRVDIPTYTAPLSIVEK